jgi:hypothetical protein
MKNKFLLTEEESQRIKSLHKKFGYRSGLLTEAEYLNQDRPGDPYQYLKVDDGTTTKYYFKGIKGEPLKKYPNWTEALGGNMDTIKSKVTFKTTAETTSQMGLTTEKTDEELYTEYFNNEFKKIKSETLPKGKITKLTDGTYGYVLDDGSYTLLSDGYSVNKDGVKSTNKWTETPFVKPVQKTITNDIQQGANTIINDITGTTSIQMIKDLILKNAPSVTIPEDILKQLPTILSTIDATTVTKVIDFLKTKTGDIQSLIALLPTDIKTKITDLISKIPGLGQSTTQQTTVPQTAGQPTLF